MEIKIIVDGERFGAFLKRHLTSRWGRFGMLAVMVTAPLLVYAATNPNTFTDGTTISASEVNQNFDAAFTAITAVEAKIAKQQTTYVRWGRKTCPTGATLVYEGFAAGKAHSHSGSGGNTLCLSKTPTYDVYSDGNQNGGLVYGLEYETSGYGISTLAANHDYEAPCAVCLVPRATQLMIPGTNQCPAGWTLEYQGYLMSVHYTHNGTQFSCVDRAAERIGSASNSDGHLWYPVEAECGSLPCGPYVQDRELTCAVCSN